MTPRPTDTNGFAQRYGAIVQTVTVVALFVAGFWAAVINPLGARLDRMESNVLAVTVTLAEYREFHNKVDSEIDKIQAEQSRRRDIFVTQLDHAKVESAIARIEIELDNMRTAQVTRGEHTQKWASDAATFASLQRQIDEIKKDFGASYSLNDKIKELQTELNEIRRDHRVP